MQKVIVIVGPTASGKSDLAIRLAKKMQGEIISADSRQVYKGLNIGSGKVTKKETLGISHHLLDVANPKTHFSADDFKKLGEQALRLIVKKGKHPIIVGGTGFYIDVLTGNTSLPDVPPNPVLRKKLFKKSVDELFLILKQRDPRRAKSIDKHNKVRLVRALEIIGKLGKVPTRQPARSTSYKFVYIGLKPSNLDKKIYTRLEKRLSGIIREVKKLHKQGLTYRRMYEFGLEYRFASMYLQKKITKKEFVEKLYIATRQYARRQITWFKINKRIKWFKPKEFRKIEKYVKVALKGD